MNSRDPLFSKSDRSAALRLLLSAIRVSRDESPTIWPWRISFNLLLDKTLKREIKTYLLDVLSGHWSNGHPLILSSSIFYYSQPEQSSLIRKETLFDYLDIVAIQKTKKKNGWMSQEKVERKLVPGQYNPACREKLDFELKCRNSCLP